MTASLQHEPRFPATAVRSRELKGRCVSTFQDRSHTAHHPPLSHPTPTPPGIRATRARILSRWERLLRTDDGRCDRSGTSPGWPKVSALAGSRPGPRLSSGFSRPQEGVLAEKSGAAQGHCQGRFRLELSSQFCFWSCLSNAARLKPTIGRCWTPGESVTGGGCLECGGSGAYRSPNRAAPRGNQRKQASSSNPSSRRLRPPARRDPRASLE